MAENIINFVLSKLVDSKLKKVLDRHDEDISRHVQVVGLVVGFQLRQIQPFLKDTDKKQIIDERQRLWLREVRDVGYSIEDVIDTFLLEDSGVKKDIADSGLQYWTGRELRPLRRRRPIDKFACGITDILTRIVKIAESRVTYGINNLGEDSGEIRLPVRPRVLPNMDPDIIGFEAIRGHLVNGLPKRLCVVSIWGPGGLGKTTLALKLYNCNDSKRQFELRIWIDISQNFGAIDILEKIAPQIQPPIEKVGLSEIQNFLSGKKYLIVLDNVPTSILWTQIREIFPDKNNGSRVLMTTRSFEVAKNADPNCTEPYKLEFLSKELSRELLLKQTFHDLDPNTSSFEHPGYSNILDQFVDKCGGLPLALVVLGRLLLKMPQHNWQNVLQTMRWGVDGENRREIIACEIIATSYVYLPFVLKSCFMYFAAFPRNYDIDARSLLQMWIAEGFIAQEDNRTLEETAESFLEDLVHRGMVQIKYRDYDGAIEYIRIHDLLQDLALQKAKEEKFLEVHSNPNVHHWLMMNPPRRVAIHTPVFRHLYMTDNLRTFLCFCDTRMGPDYSEFSLLKVVSVITGKMELDLRTFGKLTQLRYLKLGGILTDYNHSMNECYLKKVIGGMDFLETLDVKDFYRQFMTDGQLYMEEFIVPNCAWHIKTLRHVTQSTLHGLTLGPHPSAKLTNLQTISPMCIRESGETELPYLPNLRILYLIHESLSSQVIFNFLFYLEHLTSLSVESFEYYLPSDILDMRNFPFHKNLKSLSLITSSSTNHIEMPLRENMLPCNLTSLDIVLYNFPQDLMPVLEKLCLLKKLQLVNACRDRRMSCSSGGFSQLEFLSLNNLSMEEWEIEKGAMSILKELRILNCPKLGTPHGLTYLTNLQELMCRRLPSADTDSIRNLCRHVPSLDIRE